MAKRRANNEGSVFAVTRRGKRVWVAEWAIPGLVTAKGRKRVRRAYRPTQSAALEQLDAWKREAADGPGVDPGRETVADLYERFLSGQRRAGKAATTLAGYEHVRDRYITPRRLASVPLAKLSVAHVERWLEECEAAAEDPSKGKRARQYAFTTLRRVAAQGVKGKRLRFNPCDHVERPAAPKARVKSLSASEAVALLALANAESATMGAAVALGLCGLRRSECFGLDWRHVDLDAATVRVEQAYVEPAGSDPETGKRRPALIKNTKTERARTVPLIPQAVDALRALKSDTASTMLRRGAGEALSKRPLFASEAGTRLRGSVALGRTIKRLLTRVGRPDASYHALRHTAATLLIGHGVDTKTTQAVLGHATASITLDTYADAIEENVTDAGRTLGNALAAGGK